MFFPMYCYRNCFSALVTCVSGFQSAKYEANYLDMPQPNLTFRTFVRHVVVAALVMSIPYAYAASEQTEHGQATFYGKEFKGRKTASGKSYNPKAMVAAHPKYPLGSRVRVTNKRNGKEATVKIEDRGPAGKARSKNVVIDVSEAAAARLGIKKDGKAPVTVTPITVPEAKN